MEDESATCWLPFQQRLIYRWLNHHPSCYPSVDDIAGLIGLTALQYRRRIHRVGTKELRDVICWGCTAYGAELISRGNKVEYGLWRAGLKNRTNFNRNLHDFFLATVGDLRTRHPWSTLLPIIPPCIPPPGPEDWVPLDDPGGVGQPFNAAIIAGTTSNKSPTMP
jgi:hypothetical protein